MWFHLLAADYDGTLASDGRIAADTLAALRRVRESGRRVLLVTGRQLDDLLRVCPEIDIYAAIVQPHWPSLKNSDLEELTKVGTMWRLIFTMSVQAVNLRYDWVEEIMNYLMWLRNQMADSIRGFGWPESMQSGGPGSDSPIVIPSEPRDDSLASKMHR